MQSDKHAFCLQNPIIAGNRKPRLRTYRHPHKVVFPCKAFAHLKDNGFFSRGCIFDKFQPSFHIDCE